MESYISKAIIKHLNRKPIPLKIFTNLQNRYSETHRYYHTWKHIEQLTKQYEKIENKLSYKGAVFVALLYHDAIYDTHSSQNEAKSAELLIDDLTNYLEPDDCSFAVTLIQATKNHTMPIAVQNDARREDCKLFLDMDMSILGSHIEEYEEYSRNIRNEYLHVAYEKYKIGRLAVLDTFMKRSKIYFSDYYHNMLEHNARANMQLEITKLRAI